MIHIMEVENIYKDTSWNNEKIIPVNISICLFAQNLCPAQL